MKILGPAPPGVRLSRDRHGVAHVEVEGDDLAGVSWGMGYCHALDRGLQMLLTRILGQGRACELLDGSDEMLRVDRFFRRMGWNEDSSPQIERVDGASRELFEAYCEGVNARLSPRRGAIIQCWRPWELRLVGYRPEPWRPEDSILLSRMIGYIALAQSQAEMERLLVEMVQAGACDARLRALFPGVTEPWDRELLMSVKLGERIVPEAVRWLSGVPRAMASNNWVVSGSKTDSGKPMLANDPHLEVNRLPAVWYELVARWGKGRYAITATMPGLPAPLLGRTESLAWGATYSFMDGVDSWIEECRDGKRRSGDDWVPFRERRERILRKGKTPVEETFYECEHGVLDGDPHASGTYLATRWAPGRSGATSLAATADMWQARTVKQGMAALGRLETAWNWVFADRDGHIGYQMSGLLPGRRAGVSGFVPLPGWDPDNDWQGFVAPENLPRAFDPEEGFIVTANHDLNHLGLSRPINLPMGDYRARRITELLEPETTMAVADHARIQADVTSIQARELMAVLRPLLPDTEDGRLLRDWDLRYDPASRGATLFERFYRELLVAVFGAGGLGEDVIRHLLSGTGIFIDFYDNFDRVILDQDSPWYALRDDGRDRGVLFRAAFDAACGEPVPPWGEVNQVTLTHIFFAGKLPRFLGFDRGPVPLRGGRATPHQGQIYRSGGRDTSFAPSYRLIVDLGDDQAHTCLPGGASDRRFSKWYCSELDAWLEGRYKTLRA